MADFRKWILVLALVALAIPASAQITCTVASSNISIRSEGLAELVSQINLNCTSPTATLTGVTASFTAFFTTDVTSVLGAGVTTEAILRTPASTVPVQGLLNGSNSLVFNNVAIPEGVLSFVLNIDNVRVNASKIGANSSVTVIMSATSSPANSVVFTGTPTAVPAIVQTGLVFTAADPVSLPQCSAPNEAKVNVTFKEGFSGAFKSFTQEGGVSGLGITPPGSARQGTRLFIKVAAVPANVTIAVPGSITVVSGETTLTTAFLVGFNPATGGSGAGNVSGVGSGLTAISSGSQAGEFAVPLTGGSGTAVYEVTGAGLSLTTVDSIVVPVSIAISTGVGATTPTALPNVSGGFAPISTVGTAAPVTGTGSAPVPRFVDVATQNLPLFSVTPCVTNLLFPFVTNKAGFDTGIALVNTSLDNAGADEPFSTTPQSGACTVFFFDGTTTAPAPQTTGTIAAGAMTAFTLQGGGVPGSSTSAAGFQGYIIARCNFQFAHGFAFITDNGNPARPAQGYLALVIPDRGATTGRLAQPFTFGTGTGEQLAQ